ncbi:MAG TPA: ATP-binding protein [Steroidobacteraceae bacterium]|nr:ATP-binding protein [Steroidobacteraceae bacterium]
MLFTPSELARRALDSAPDAMVIIDQQGVVLFANRQVSAQFGYAHEEIIGRTLDHLIPPLLRGQHVVRGGATGEQPSRAPDGAGPELFGRREDGTEFPLEISSSPVEDGGHAFIATIRNVADRKRAEAELIVAREDADRANLSKGRFLATASHDLRQPVQTLSLLNGTLRRIVAEPAAAAAVDQQERAIQAMSRLLNALLDISKLESGIIKPEPSDFTVDSLFGGLRRDFASAATSKGLTLKIDECAACAHSDPSLVEQILRNLVSNAIKYTREGWVRLRCLREQARVRIEVRDSGIGIPADQLGYIYDEFYQVAVATNASRDGYGLGLCIVQRLVRLLDLRLEVRSEVGKGSAFALVLPAAGGPAIPAGADSAQSPALLARVVASRVLLVEDDDAVRDATCMLLTVEGYRVTAVASLAQALHEARESERPDLLVTDYHLRGEETGIQVIARLRESLDPAMKAVLITGDTSSAVKELPRDRHLRIASKPVKSDELLALLGELLAT